MSCQTNSTYEFEGILYSHRYIRKGLKAEFYFRLEVPSSITPTLNTASLILKDSTGATVDTLTTGNGRITIVNSLVSGIGKSEVKLIWSAAQTNALPEGTISGNLQYGTGAADEERQVWTFEVMV